MTNESSAVQSAPHQSPAEQELPASSVSAASVRPIESSGSLGSEAFDVQQPATARGPHTGRCSICGCYASPAEQGLADGKVSADDKASTASAGGPALATSDPEGHRQAIADHAAEREAQGPSAVERVNGLCSSQDWNNATLGRDLWEGQGQRINWLRDLALEQAEELDRLRAENRTMRDRLAPSIEYVEGIAVGYGEDEIDRLRAENERLKDSVEQAELDRDMWKAELGRTTKEYQATTREALRQAECAEAENAKLHDDRQRAFKLGYELVAECQSVEEMTSALIASVQRAMKHRQEAEAALRDDERLTRELDVVWNGEQGAAKQPSLCDVLSQIRKELPALRGGVVVPEEMPDKVREVFEAWVRPINYLSRRDVPWRGTENGDDPAEWEGRFWNALYKAALAATKEGR